MTRIEIFQILNEKVPSLKAQRLKPLRICVTGIQGTGKTVFCQQWTQDLQGSGLDALHLSIDAFHNTREIRYRQGRDSAKGYYEDAYNEKAFVEKVLNASQNEPPQVTMSVYDQLTDEHLNLLPVTISPQTIIVVDGSYLLKEIYRRHWDLKIYLKTDFQTAQNRGTARDAAALGGIEAAIDKYIKRYHLASQMYLEEIDPISIADIVIETTDFENLEILKGS